MYNIPIHRLRFNFGFKGISLGKDKVFMVFIIYNISAVSKKQSFRGNSFGQRSCQASLLQQRHRLTVLISRMIIDISG